MLTLNVIFFFNYFDRINTDLDRERGGTWSIGRDYGLRSRKGVWSRGLLVGVEIVIR